MHEFSILTIPNLLKDSVERFGERPALAFVGCKPLTYNILQKEVNAVMAFLEQQGIEPGDRVAILSSNMPNWGVAFFAIASMGIVIVPILPDFTDEEVENVLQHSEAKAIFVSDNLKKKVKLDK